MNKDLHFNELNELKEPNKLKELFSSLLFYFAILFFIIGFGFRDTPTPFGWYQQFMPNLNGRQITDVFFLDSLNGWSVTNATNQQYDTTYVLETTNSGDNWSIQYRKNQNGGGFSGYFRIYFLNQNIGYTCGVTGFDKTTNGGINWAPVWTADTYVDMSILNIDTQWLVSSNSLTGGVFLTTNGGVNWVQQLNLGSSNPDHIYMLNGRIGFICKASSGNSIRKTIDGGQSWIIVVSNEGFEDINFIDSLNGFRSWGTMKRTTDGGLSWQTQIMPYGGNIITSTINKFSVINKDTLWGVGGQIHYGIQSWGIIYNTYNGGINWGFQLPDTSIYISGYDFNKFINKLNGWAYTGSPGVHTVSGGDTVTYMGIKQISSKVPDKFVLFQNYPNPFNPNTNIKYQISNIKKQISNIKISVFDITGKHMIDLVNEKQTPGEYLVTFDGSKYSSGVYFYSLIVDGLLIETKRMILLK